MSYVHNAAADGMGKIGVLVAYSGGDEGFARQVAMHIAAINPASLSEADLDPALVERPVRAGRHRICEGVDRVGAFGQQRHQDAARPGAEVQHLAARRHAQDGLARLVPRDHVLELRDEAVAGVAGHEQQRLGRTHEHMGKDGPGWW